MLSLNFCLIHQIVIDNLIGNHILRENMNIPFIVIIRDNVVDTIHQSTPEKCESDFLGYCSHNLTNWSEYDQEDIDAIVENGYETMGNGSICLTWVDVDMPAP